MRLNRLAAAAVATAGLLLVPAALLPAVAAAAPSPHPPAPTTPATNEGVPYPAAGTCVDPAELLVPGTCAKVRTVLAADAAATTDEIAVAVVRTTGGPSIESWSTGLFNAWGVGKKDENNGVLLVIALDDRRLRIVTGDGLRTRLPDYRASEIVGSTITPYLRQDDPTSAVLAGLDDIRHELGHDVTASSLSSGAAPVPVADRPEPVTRDGGGGAGGLWVVVVIAVLITIGWGIFTRSARSEYEGMDEADKPWYLRSNRRGYHGSDGHSGSAGFLGGSSSSHYHSSGGSSGSSGGDFGGGHSSGGGASGSW